MDDGYVLIIGSAGIDVKGRPATEIKFGMSNPGKIRNSIGGVARNIAENLARLEVNTMLLSAVGDDVEGWRVIEYCEDNGIDCEHVQIIKGERTGTYLALLKPDGELMTAIGDFEIMSAVDSEYLRIHEDKIADAAMLVIDATLSEKTLETLFELTEQYAVPVCADPTTPALATKLCPYLDKIYLIVPNAAETKALCGLSEPAHDRDTAISAARQLVSLGARIAVVTMAEQGLAYADSGGAGFIRAVNTHVTDSTGAGDALTGAVIFGLLNDVPLDEAMRLGVTAAALTLQTEETVVPDLNQELLYDRLMV